VALRVIDCLDVGDQSRQRLVQQVNWGSWGLPGGPWRRPATATTLTGRPAPRADCDRLLRRLARAIRVPGVSSSPLTVSPLRGGSWQRRDLSPGRQRDS